MPPYEHEHDRYTGLHAELRAIRALVGEHRSETNARFNALDRSLVELRKDVQKRDDRVDDEFDSYQQRVTALEQGMKFRTWVGGMFTAVLTWLQLRHGQ